ncbi:MAG: type 4a pilus biogenesis protein PilO [Coriobacteriia bacterium]|nr:type 4a pilus biogenesis protein PilO [Coriobacteriia bacterium]
MKIGPREQIGIAIGLTVVVLIAIFALLVWPQWQKLGETDKSIADARTQVQTAKALLATREDSKQHASDTDAKWMRLANLVPDGPDLPSLIVELQDGAFASGVQMLGVTPSTPVATANYYSIPIQVEVVGSWADTVDYLQRIMKFSRGIRIVESSTVRVNNPDLIARENLSIPDYSQKTVIKLEAYMIPTSAGATSTAPAATAPATGQ